MTDLLLMTGDVLIALAMLCALTASLRLALRNFVVEPRHRIVAFLSAPGWCALLLGFLPMSLGEAARGESSFVPWRVFAEEASRHGSLSGAFAGITAVTVDLWLLWIPAHLYLAEQPDADRRVRVLARLLNLSVGVLLMTPGNPLLVFAR